MEVMNPNHLRTFLAVHRHSSFTRAAEEVSLSQPAVSRHIKQLEEELGVALFDQVGKVPHLTDAGDALVAEAERVLGALERAAEVVRARETNVVGTLRIGASTAPGFYLLPECLRRFLSEHPAVDVDYVVEDSRKVERMLIRNEIDVGFVGVPVSSEVLVASPIVEDKIVCFAGASHPLARKRRISPLSLVNELAVTRESGSATRQIFEGWLEQAGAKLGRTIEVHCSEAAKVLVRSGLGFSFMSLSGIEAELHAGVLHKLSITGLRLTRPIYAVHHVRKRLSPAAVAFLSIVRERCRV
jgi:DNA-binding transcriptional LysR family regulator